jgi:glycyl-tRNA synthetase beta subunit
MTGQPSADRAVDARLPSHQHYWQQDLAIANDRHQLEMGIAWHVDLGQQHIEIAVLKSLRGSFASVHGIHREPRPL